ncbi:MAG: hypothetical protein L0I76_25085 [Pseudonocardia sp.]|nr:hypothetical protein [Pseudonocardia sp.]
MRISPTTLWISFPLFQLQMHVLGPHERAVDHIEQVREITGDPRLLPGNRPVLGAPLGP